MLYYRTTQGIGPVRPPELAGFRSPAVGVDLQEASVNGWRVLGIADPMRFDPPAEGWATLVPASEELRLMGAEGWQIVSVGEFNPSTHIKTTSAWRVADMQIQGQRWMAPHVLGADGVRAFKVAYGGPDFSPILTDEQAKALALAEEIRAAILASDLPAMPIRARWAARLLPLVYCLSEGSLQLVGMSEDLIDATLRVAAGLYEQRG